MKRLCLVTLLFSLASRAEVPAVVSSFDLNAYLGKWFEIERIPNSFQDNRPKGAQPCRQTTAEYVRRDDGKINVTNRCLRTSIQGDAEEDVARAIARVPDAKRPAKLKVNFTGLSLLRWLGIGDGDYWICALGPLREGLYSWALVCSPSRKYGWILSRKEVLSPAELGEVRQAQKLSGYAADSFRPSK